jgi:hypothetical protein
MCMGGGPPYGIPVTDDLHKKYPPRSEKGMEDLS